MHLRRPFGPRRSLHSFATLETTGGVAGVTGQARYPVRVARANLALRIRSRDETLSSLQRSAELILCHGSAATSAWRKRILAARGNTFCELLNFSGFQKRSILSGVSYPISLRHSHNGDVRVCGSSNSCCQKRLRHKAHSINLRLHSSRLRRARAECPCGCLCMSAPQGPRHAYSNLMGDQTFSGREGKAVKLDRFSRVPRRHLQSVSSHTIDLALGVFAQQRASESTRQGQVRAPTSRCIIRCGPLLHFCGGSGWPRGSQKGASQEQRRVPNRKLDKRAFIFPLVSAKLNMRAARR